MATRYSATVAESFTLRARFRRGGALYDPDTVPHVVLADSNLVEVLRVETVTRISAGVYEVTIPALEEPGVYADYWFYRDTEDGPLHSVSLSVVVGPVVGSAADAATAAVEADIGDANLCIVTAQFYTASGAGMSGVRVTFQPGDLMTQFHAQGIITDDAVWADSDSSGALSLSLVRGVRGWISCTYMQMVREIGVPDEDTVSLQDIESLVPDLLTARTPAPLYALPRRS